MRTSVVAPLLALAAYASAPQPSSLSADLDRIFADPVLSRALVGIRIESLAEGLDPGARLIYEKNSAKLVMPASNMKLHTLAAAADRLGWDFRYGTRLEAAGVVRDGTLEGDLVVMGGGDPTIVSLDFGPAPLFTEWADALWRAGVRRVDGRLIGDDRLFEDEGLGPGWAWDYLSAGYAAPSGALSYNENIAILRAWPGAGEGATVRVELSPPGHLLAVENELTTGPAGSPAQVELLRLPGSARLTVRGRVPAGGSVVTRETSVDQPTRFFLEALRLALAGRGITIAGGAWPVGDVKDPPVAAGRRVIAERESAPLSAIAGYFMKVSQNFYAEMLFKTLGRAAGRPGSVAEGRRAARDTFSAWGIPADSYVMHDGSGLSRYDYTSAEAIVSILAHVWRDERLRGPFVASLPVGGHDGTLDTRMRGTVLDGRVEAKTGTISNVRSLSGYLETKRGERLVFSIIANNFTATSGQVDAVVEKALARLFDK